MCNQLLNRQICTHTVPGVLQPCAIRHLVHPIIPLTIYIAVPCPTCAAPSFYPQTPYLTPQLAHALPQPFVLILPFQQLNPALQPQQVYLPGSTSATPIMLPPRIVQFPYAPFAPPVIQQPSVVPIHGQPIPWVFTPPPLPAPAAFPPIQTQFIPIPTQAAQAAQPQVTHVPAPAGIPSPTHSESLGGQTSQITHDDFRGNQMIGAGATRQGWNAVYGYDAGNLPPGWGVGDPLLARGEAGPGVRGEGGSEAAGRSEEEGGSNIQGAAPPAQQPDAQGSQVGSAPQGASWASASALSSTVPDTHNNLSSTRASSSSSMPHSNASSSGATFGSSVPPEMVERSSNSSSTSSKSLRFGDVINYSVHPSSHGSLGEGGQDGGSGNAETRASVEDAEIFF